MKLEEAVSWLTGTLQRNLIPLLEECWERPLTGKERQLVSILELVHIEMQGYWPEGGHPVFRSRLGIRKTIRRWFT